LSRVGRPWDEVYSEAVARLDQRQPIFWMAALKDSDQQDYFRAGESSYYSGLRVDEQGILRLVNESISAETLEPQCRCCTHTFNGVRFKRSYGDPSIVE
jgi:hypothetical protein